MLKQMTQIFTLWILATFSAFVSAANSPNEVVKSAADQLIESLTKEKEKISKQPQIISNLVSSIILPIVDTDLMAKLALGKKHWSQASSEQKQQFSEGFKKLLVKTYSAAFASYNGQKMIFKEAKFNSKGDKAMVRSEILQPSSGPIQVDYKLYKNKAGEWLMYDAVVAGLALIKTYRVQFNEQINKEGLEKTLLDLNKQVASVN